MGYGHPRIEGSHLRETYLPRLNYVLSTANFAPQRFYVQRMYLCAAVISEDKDVIHELVSTRPSWSITQDMLNWQSDDITRRNTGDVFQHLSAMSHSRDCPRPNQYLLQMVESSLADSRCCHSIRLSSLEVCNAEKPMGYHIGATSMKTLPGFENNEFESELWSKFLFHHLVETDDESPYIFWGRRRVQTAVLWHVQIDIVDNWRGGRPCYVSKRLRHGPLAWVPELQETQYNLGESSRGKKKTKVLFGDCKSQYKGVRHRLDRGPTGVWVAETRLPAKEKKRDKVSFGDYKSDYEAARAIDAAFHYYHKGPCNFRDSPELLQTLPSLDGLEGDKKLKAVKERAKWLAANAPASSTTRPSPTPTAEAIASPGLSRLNFGGSKQSALVSIPNYMFDNLLTITKPLEFNQAVEPFALNRIAKPLTLNQRAEPFELNQALELNQAIEPFELNQAIEPFELNQAIEPFELNQALGLNQAREPFELNQALGLNQAIEPFELNQALEPFKLNQALEPFEWNQALEPFEWNQALEPFEFNHAVNHPYEERTLSRFGDAMSWLLDDDPHESLTPSSSTATFMYSAALSPQYNPCNVSDWVNAFATQSASPGFPRESDHCIVDGLLLEQTVDDQYDSERTHSCFDFNEIPDYSMTP